MTWCRILTLTKLPDFFCCETLQYAVLHAMTFTIMLETSYLIHSIMLTTGKAGFPNICFENCYKYDLLKPDTTASKLCEPY